MEHPVRLELTLAGLPVKVVNYYTTQSTQNDLSKASELSDFCNYH